MRLDGNQSAGRPDPREPWAGGGWAANASLPGGEASFPLPTFSAAAKVRVGLTAALFVASASLNLAVLRSAGRRYQRRPHLRLLLTNLAAADLLVTFVVMPLDAAWNATVQWYAGDLACRLLMFLKLAAMYASAFVTVVISLDRRAAILHPLSLGEAKRTNKAMLCAAWGLSGLLALPQLFVFHAVSPAHPVRFVQCATVGSFRARWQETLYNMFTFSCLFLGPLLIMVACYARIFVEISGKMKTACASAKSREFDLRRSRNNIPRVRLRTLRMSAVIVLTFVVCWTPYYLLGLWYWFCPEMLTSGRVPPSLSHLLFLFGLFNACLDPLVYGFFARQVPARGGRRDGGCCCGGSGRRRRKAGEGSLVLTGSFRASTASVAGAKPPRDPWEPQPERAAPDEQRALCRASRPAESLI